MQDEGYPNFYLNVFSDGQLTTLPVVKATQSDSKFFPYTNWWLRNELGKISWSFSCLHIYLYSVVLTRKGKTLSGKERVSSREILNKRSKQYLHRCLRERPGKHYVNLVSGRITWLHRLTHEPKEGPRPWGRQEEPTCSHGQTDTDVTQRKTLIPGREGSPRQFCWHW